MSVIDKVIAAVTPPESEEARRTAREQARRSASSGDWLEQVLDHHLQIEAAFASVKDATSAEERTAALKALAIVLTGHANAEESVLYPALARVDEKAHAMMGYGEQAAAKVQMGLLENLPPMSQDFLDKLEHVRGAVTHHMYQEEGTWFLDLKRKAPLADQAKLGARYQEEYDRYVGADDELVPETTSDPSALLGQRGRGDFGAAPMR